MKTASLPIAGFQGTTLIDYPGKVASIIFLAGCNLRCPYCHNGSLLSAENCEIIPQEKIFSELERRKKLIEGVVITGGEPLLYDLRELIQTIRETGLSVKLDTNGFFPEKLKEILPLLDFVAIDLKALPVIYKTQLGAGQTLPVETFLRQTKTILEESGVSTEYRTTLYPNAVASLSDLEHMKEYIPKHARWVLQQFHPEHAWNEEAKKVTPFDIELVREWGQKLGVNVRGL